METTGKPIYLHADLVSRHFTIFRYMYVRWVFADMRSVFFLVFSDAIGIFRVKSK